MDHGQLVDQIQPSIRPHNRLKKIIEAFQFKVNLGAKPEILWYIQSHADWEVNQMGQD